MLDEELPWHNMICASMACACAPHVPDHRVEKGARGRILCEIKEGRVHEHRAIYAFHLGRATGRYRHVDIIVV